MAKEKKRHRLTIRKKLAIANMINKTPTEICKEYHIHKRTYQRIKQQYGTPRKLLRENSELKKDISRLKEHCKKQEEMIEIMQVADVKYTDSRSEKLDAADNLYPKYHASAIIAALGITRGGFFNHVYRNKKDKTWFNVRREKLKPQIKEIFEESRELYGADKIAGVLRNRGVNTSKQFVSSIMKELGIHGVENKRLKRRKKKLAEMIRDLIKEFKAYAPNVLWVTDFTDFKDINDNVIYLCVYLDIFSRLIVGYSFSEVADTPFVSRALKTAVEKRHHPVYLLLHSDQGSQYTSDEFDELTDRLDIVRSYSHRGKPSDNPVAEGFFSVMKREMYRDREFISIREIKEVAEDYIKFYNNKRVHTSIGYVSPAEYERQYWDKKRREKAAGSSEQQKNTAPRVHVDEP